MPIQKIFNNADIQELIDNNSKGDFRLRNSALIIAASYWGLTRTEICLMPLDALMCSTGEFYSEWYVPPEIAFNGKARVLYTSDSVAELLDRYVDWLVERKVCKSNLYTFRQLQPDMKFFVNDNLAPFALTKSSKRLVDGGVSYKTRTLDDKLKGFITNTSIQGATVSTFRDSWVKNMYDNGCRHRDLQDISGFVRKSTIDAKIRPFESELQGVFNKVFSRISFNGE